MKVILLLFIAIVFTACDPSVNEYAFLKPDKYDLANTVVAETSFQLKRDKNLIPFGTGRKICDQIQMLALTFICYKETEIDEARELLLEAFKVMVHVINSNEEIRPYLCQYPFDQNLEMSIYFRKPNGHRDFGQLGICSIKRGKLEYIIQNSTYNYTTILSETYEEAESKGCVEKFCRENLRKIP